MLMRYTWPAAWWTLMILIVTLIPGEAVPEVDVEGIDKGVHFIIFAVLMLTSSFSLKKTRDTKNLPTSSFLIPALYSIGLGVTIEFLQRLVPGRSFSVADMLANTIGVGIGYLIFILLKKTEIV